MNRDRLYFLLLNIGHFLDHLFTLIFATVAALALHRDWGISYAELLVYATPGFFALGIFALPAGWLADKWSRDGMMSVFFVGIGATSIATSFAQTPLQIGAGLFVIGMFAAIYHPVGLAIVTMTWRNTGMRIAANGVWGNLGVACAALITGYLIDNGGWRIAYILPGIFSIITGFVFIVLRWQSLTAAPTAPKALHNFHNLPINFFCAAENLRRAPARIRHSIIDLGRKCRRPWSGRCRNRGRRARFHRVCGGFDGTTRGRQLA
jgi:MFS family permease